MTVCVAIYRLRMYDEIGGMIADALEGLGCEVFLAWDGDPRALESDLLLLIADVSLFPIYRRMLPHTHVRPRIAVWQLDPLMPAGAFSEAEECRMAALNGIFQKSKKWPKPFRSARRIFRRVLERGLGRHWEEGEYKGEDFEYLLGVLRRSVGCVGDFRDGWIDMIFSGSPPRGSYLESRGVQSHPLPFGYHPSMGVRTDEGRDIDVIYYGWKKGKRRKDNLAAIKGALARKGIAVYETNETYGDELVGLLKRAKVTLNLTTCPWDYAGIRFLRSMACGSVVVSERGAETGLYLPGTHFVDSEIDDTPDAIERLVKDDAARAEVADAAWRLVSKELTLEREMRKMLDAIGAVAR